MKKLEIEIDAGTESQLFWLSKLYNCTPQELFIKAIQQMAKSEIDNYPLLGGWENEAEMVDKMLDDIITNRGRSKKKEVEKSPA
ncbi:hypothetical protein A0J48_005135 [Sphaerospermopsis aphanizomenoides BCCUSP55]|uniref:hypothetical protein n=1 Tax=Sphaerospermopsis aphanizomenoides TaxID=459663 RepID=UPI001905CB5E|nr:hypothetical protein [Sphaerospermopsis aphanizomenoides]MBK1986931.1 hypothetical protein [Sphaerospermopsis aphanizomenoides BCCUSP55]